MLATWQCPRVVGGGIREHQHLCAQLPRLSPNQIPVARRSKNSIFDRNIDCRGSQESGDLGPTDRERLAELEKTVVILVDCLTRRTKIANEAMDRLALPPMNRTFRDIGWRIVYCHPIRKEVPLERAIEVERNGFHSVLGVCWPHGSESLELMAHRAVKGCKELSQQIRNGEDLAYDDPPVWPVVVAHKLDSEVATVARMMDVGYITSVTGDMQGVTREKMEASRRRWVILACARAAALGALGLAGAAVMRHLNGSFWLGFAGAVMASLLKIILEMFAPKFEPAWKSQLVALSGFAIVLVYGSSPWGFSNVKALLLEIFHVLILSVAQHPLDKLLRWRAAVE